MIILVASEKGGAGKTTVATNISAMLATQGRDVLLLDTDVQGSSALWGNLRNAQDDVPTITVFQKTGVVNQEVAKVVSKYDDIVIDAGGRDSEEMRSAMLVAHLWYIPIQPSQYDVWTISKMSSIFTQMRSFNPDLKPRLLVNRASTHVNHNDYDDIKTALESTTDVIKMSKCQLYERSAYKRSACQGLCVTELRKTDFDRKAAQEIQQIYEEILNGD